MRRGELTVFFSLIFLLIVALLTVMVENSRRHGVRMQIQAAADAACESAFAGYDTELLNQFKVFFFDGSAGNGQITESCIASNINNDMNEILHPEEEISGLYADFYKISLDETDVNTVALATDDGGMVYRQQAILSMKGRYGISFAEQLLEQSNLVKENIEEGENYKKSQSDNEKELISLQEQKSEIDKENEAAAEEASKNKNPATVMEVQKSLGILELVKPQDFNVSQKQMDLSVLPSKRELNKGAGLNNYSEDLLSNVLFNEYLMEMFNCASDTSDENNGQINYQIEYLLSGKEHDVDNLKAVVEKLLLIREGANFTYLLTDSTKMSEAEGAAMLLVGYTGLIPLIEVTKYAILLSWAFAESTLDVKRLLAGKKVDIIKNSGNWQLALSNIENAASETLKDDSDGITYRQYLRLLLLLEPQKNLAGRCLDLVEMKMRSLDLYQNFKLDFMVCRMGINMTLHSDSVFCVLPFMRSYIRENLSEYKVERNFSYEIWQ